LLLLSSVYKLLPNDNVCSSWPIPSKFNTMKTGTGVRLWFIYVICEKIEILLLNIKHLLVLSDSSITVIVASNAYSYCKTNEILLHTIKKTTENNFHQCFQHFDFSELALGKRLLRTKQTSSSYHWNVTCSRHVIGETIAHLALSNHSFTILHYCYLGLTRLPLLNVTKPLSLLF